VSPTLARAVARYGAAGPALLTAGIYAYLVDFRPAVPRQADAVSSYVREVVVKRQPVDVFAFCSDLRNELRWNPVAESIELVTGEPIGVGARYRARWRGAPATVVELVALDPPRSWATRSRTLGMEARTAGSVEPCDGGSRYRIRVELHLRGVSHLFAPLAIRLMARQETRNMARIRTALEGQGGTLG
jgi:hypothetical protein